MVKTYVDIDVACVLFVLSPELLVSEVNLLFWIVPECEVLSFQIINHFLTFILFSLHNIWRSFVPDHNFGWRILLGLDADKLGAIVVGFVDFLLAS